MDTTFFDHLLHEFELPLKNPVLVFSIILLIILLSPLVLKRFRIPSIIGLIVSGIIIGPHVLNLLARNSAVNLFSTIGLLYIMFIAGLELEMNEFKKNKYKSLTFGFFTFLIPLLIGFPICHYLLGYGMSASILTASMFATHTLVAYPIVTKFGISRNEAVAIAVGGTILTDTAVLIILAVIIGAEQGGLTQQFWIRLITSLTIFSLIMFLLVPRVAKWFFTKVESEKTSHYIFVLSVVFFAAFLAEVAGVEAIIGAFVAGLVLNRLIPHSSALMNRIEFVGNAIFIPFFLISVGMLVDVRVLLKGPTALIVAGALTVAAVAGKWLAALFTQWTFRYSKQQGQLIFGLSSAHAAATLAIILVGFEVGIIDENILNGTIILILVTCIVASFVTENAARKLVMVGETGTEVLNEIHESRTENILIPISNFNNMEQMLDLAVLLKEKHSPNPVTLLSVVPNNNEAEVNLHRARKKLSESIKYASASETNIDVVVTIDHNIASGVIRASKERMANIILSGWPHRTTLLDKFLGEKMESIIEQTDKNLFICHTDSSLIGKERIFLVCPQLTEYELGFPIWLSKVCRLAQELSLDIICHCTDRTRIAIEAYLAAHNLGVKIEFEEFSDWDDFLVLARDIKPEDLLIVVCARKGSLSYLSNFDSIPKKLDRHFHSQAKLVIYPQVKSVPEVYHEIEV